MDSRMALVYADGGARGNPGPAGCGAVVYDQWGQPLAFDGVYLGETTNNVAEYHGLILGLRIALRTLATRATVRMDSKLVVEQMSGRWKVKSATLAKLHGEASALGRQFEAIAYEWVPREQNREADSLANQAMDGRTPKLTTDQATNGLIAVRHVSPVLSIRTPTPKPSEPALNPTTKTERVELTAQLAADYRVPDPTAAVRTLRECAPAELAEIWGSLPGERWLLAAIQASPLAWNRGLLSRDGTTP